LDAYQGLRAGFFSALEKAQRQLRVLGQGGGVSNKPKLMITGHSLGGAIASIAAMDLKFNSVNASVLEGFASLAVWTFESPRPGDPHFSATLTNNVTSDMWTVENYFDLIPDLPGEDVGFMHPLRIALVGPHPGEIRELTEKQDATNHEAYAHTPVYYHSEEVVMSMLNGLPGAAPAPGRPEQCAQLK
jgi:hypothetical protein